MNLINESTGGIYVFSSNIHIGSASSLKLIKYKINRGGFFFFGGGGGREYSPPPCLNFFFCYKNTEMG